MALKFIAAAAVTAALAFSASAANATVFAGNWTLTIGDNSDPGHLKVFTDTTGGLFSKDLAVTDPQYEDLFQIWTNEGTVNPDDLNNTSVTLKFTFTSPGDNDGPIYVGGNANGYAEIGGFFQGGQLIWNNGGVAQLEWANNTPGVTNPGLMTLTVSGGRFNEGLFWSTDQNCNWHGQCNPQADSLGVTAKFDWDNDPTFAAVPEPGTWALMIGGFGLAGATLRRRRAIAA